MLKKRISIILLIFIALILVSYKSIRNGTLNERILNHTQESTNSNINQSNGIYEITKASYVDKNARISYPQITKLGDNNKEKTINEIIKNEALKVLNYYSGVDSGFNLEINYEIKWHSVNLLSIQYSGLGNVEGAAHPNHLFYTTNININKEKRQRLQDLIKIDENIVEYFRNGKFKALNSEQNGILDSYADNDLINQLKNADSLDNIGTENQSDTFSYLTKDSLGISVSVGAAAGDHAEFEIKYQDIAKNIKTENEVWKDFS